MTWGRVSINIYRIVKVLLMFSCLLYPGFSLAFDVAVLKSTEINPYNDALRGFSKTCGCSVEEISVHNREESEIRAAVRDMNADAVLAIGMDAVEHTKSIKNVPIIYTMVPFFRPITHHQQSMSGVSMYISPDKYLAAMRDLFPDVRRIGVVYDPHFNEPFIKEAAEVVRAIGLQLLLKTVSRATDAPAVIESMKDLIDIYWMVPDVTVVTPEVVNRLLLFSFRNRVPVFTFTKKYVEMGAAAGITVSPFDIGLQTGDIARRLSFGGDGAEPVRLNARKTIRLINSRVAKKLGISFPESATDGAEDVR